MGLAAERSWDEISLADVADRAGVTLAQFRDFFPSKGAVLGGFSRRIDKIVLDERRRALRRDRQKTGCSTC